MRKNWNLWRKCKRHNKYHKRTSFYDEFTLQANDGNIEERINKSIRPSEPEKYEKNCQDQPIIIITGRKTFPWWLSRQAQSLVGCSQNKCTTSTTIYRDVISIVRPLLQRHNALEKWGHRWQNRDVPEPREPFTFTVQFRASVLLVMILPWIILQLINGK